MSIVFPDTDFVTESDVEQKFILPLLTQQRPTGLGYATTDFRTKEDIRHICIDKGSKSKVYYPDYVVIVEGLPLMVIEAKKPTEELDEGFREARLYAAEINASYPAGINPCARVVVTTAQRTVAGNWDSDMPVVGLSLEDMETTSPKFQEFVEFTSRTSLEKLAAKTAQLVRGKAKYYKPVHMLGGRTTRGGSVGQNSFGVNISLEYKYLFNPETEEERRAVVTNAYVRSKKREAHVRPIDRIIRRFATPSNTETREISDSSRPSELLETLADPWKYEHELCLLIGSVGSGKSTFVDYLREVALDEVLRAKTEWLIVNLNNAPVAKDLIYTWLVDQLLQKLRAAHPKFDFDNMEFLKKAFASEIAAFEKGPISVFPRESERRQELVFKEMTRLVGDRNKLLGVLTRYLFGTRRRLLLVALDNCDKRSRDSQLLMFEVANWLRNEFHCIVFLPLRETTFDQYRREPPLDTVISDLVFRIDPPLLERVIYARFNYAIRQIKEDQSDFHYILTNGIRVACKRDEIASYLRSILTSIFQNDYSKRLVVGLSGRNIRMGLEIFLDFCKSGYITEDEIFRIKEAEGEHTIPPYMVTNIILKGLRIFYADDHSRIKNLFHSDRDDAMPDPFVRLAVLKWLSARAGLSGPSGMRGYHKAEALVRDLKTLGHNETRLREEIDALLAAECIISESQKSSITDDHELLALTPAGVVHLDLLKNVNYLSTVAEDTWFRDQTAASRIAENLTGRGRFPSTSRQAVIENSKCLVEYMVAYQQTYLPRPESYLIDENLLALSDCSGLAEHVQKVADADMHYIDYQELEGRYPPGTVVDAQVVSIQNYGLFVNFGLNGVALIQNSTFSPSPTFLVTSHNIT